MIRIKKINFTSDKDRPNDDSVFYERKFLCECKKSHDNNVNSTNSMDNINSQNSQFCEDNETENNSIDESNEKKRENVGNVGINNSIHDLIKLAKCSKQ